MNRREQKNEQILTQGGVPRLRASLSAPVVLLAEDDPDLRAIIAGELRRARYEVLDVRDGTELWRMLSATADTPDDVALPDLVISDVRMPGLDGIAVLARLREVDWFMPVILMTAFGDAATRLAARRLGARILDKPLDLDRLVETARELAGPA